MSKFAKATKRITAVAASAALVSSAVFGASLGSYPNNFVSDGEFDGKVVVGASADAMDTASATSIIDNLKDEFSGSSEKVRITYKSSSEGGEEVDAVKSTSQLNYGETLGSVTETGGFDDSDADVLEDGKFDNGISDEDYEQTITLSNGVFNYALRDEVEGVDEIANGIFYSNDQAFATYTLDLKNAINLSTPSTQSDLDDDMVGKTLTIMGNEFTIGSITRDTDDLDKLELLGGANKVSLGEGESTTVTIDGNSFEVSVQSVSTDKVLISVNGQSKSIDEFDTEDLGGVTIAVTDIVSSSRDLVKGYAELVVGGQKVTIEDGNTLVKVNDEDVDDLFEGYEVYADMSDSQAGMDTITITYQVSEDTLLEAGDSLNDVLFDAFELVYEGTNNPEYSTVELTSADDDVKIDGELINGEDVDGLMIHMDSANNVYLTGDQDSDRIFYSGSVYMNIDSDNGTNGISAINSSSGALPVQTGGAIDMLQFNLADSSIDGSGFIVYSDDDEQYLYEIDSVDTNDNEVDVTEYFDGKDKDGLTATEFGTDLEVSNLGNGVGTFTNFSLSNLSTPVIGFANELLIDFDEVESIALAAAGGNLTVSLDEDVDGDNAADELENFNISIGFDTGSDDEFTLTVGSSSHFVNSGNEDNKDGDNDVQTLVTVYGTKVEYDNDEKTWVKIMTPEEQVYANVNLVFGGSGSVSESVTVAAAEAEAKVAELEEEGYTIVEEVTMTQEEVEFDVTAPVTDADVSGASDMIVVGGPAVNAVARELLGIEAYTMEDAGVAAGEAVVQYFADSNSVLVYGYAAEDTKAAAEKLNAGGLTGDLVNVQ